MAGPLERGVVGVGEQWQSGHSGWLATEVIGLSVAYEQESVLARVENKGREESVERTIWSVQ